MRLVITILLLQLPNISAAWADCTVDTQTASAIRQQAKAFEATPSAQSAQAFFDLIPSRFCEFEYVFMGGDDFLGELYEIDLHDLLPEIIPHLDTKAVSHKLVSLASEGAWDADNINALQDTYNELLVDHSDTVVKDIMSLPREKRNTAIKFLFDGFHPSKKYLSEHDEKRICKISKGFCDELGEVKKALDAEETQH